MRKSIENLRANHGDTARVVLFQLAAALTADYFLLWPRRNVNPVKAAVNCVYALLIHGVAYKAAKYLETPKVQPEISKSKTEKDNKGAQTQNDPNALVRPATP